MKKKHVILMLLGFLVICEIIFALLMKEIVSNSPGFEIFDMRIFYTMKQFQDNLDLLQNDSVKALIQFRLLDTLFPVIYGLFLFTLLKQVQEKNKLFLGVPLIGMSFDYLENILLTIKTFFTNYHDYLIYFTNAFTLIKFTCLLISVSLIIYFWKKGRGKNEYFRNKASIY